MGHELSLAETHPGPGGKGRDQALPAATLPLGKDANTPDIESHRHEPVGLTKDRRLVA